MDFLQIIHDRQRLHQDFAVIELQRGHARLRIDGAELRPELRAAIAGKVNRHAVIGDALEIERDAGAEAADERK